tara:strand:- start:128 stop:901 length:774 start_codon:yes stop_codon:yes gene_type:complete
MIKRQTERFTVFSVESDEARARRAVFESLAALDYDEARMASRSERKALGKEREGTLTYGEVPYLAMIVILDKVRELRMEIDPHTTGDAPFCEDVFVDLGSGAGRPCLAAASLYTFKACIGVEILQSLHDQAVKAGEEYEDLILNQASSLDVTRKVQLYLGSIFDLDLYDWVSARGVILANSTCFSKDMFKKIADLAANTHEQNILVTFSEDLDNHLPWKERRFELLAAVRTKMSWGDADVFYHRVKPSSGNRKDEER